MKTLVAYTIIIFTSCNSSDESLGCYNTRSLEVSSSASTNSVFIDEIVKLTAPADRLTYEISYSLVGGLTLQVASSANFYFSFDIIGTNTIIFKVKNFEGEILDNELYISAQRCSTLKVNNFQGNSFFEKGNTWDQDYSEADISHLVDVFFNILKHKVNLFTGIRYEVLNCFGLFYFSDTGVNGESLSWNLISKKLYDYISTLTLFIAYEKDDINELVDDIMQISTFQREISLIDYFQTQSESITLQEFDINLNYEFEIDW